ncbi:MAG TPA: hypothetical protein VFN64_09875 [Burkholderiaceae bacterium]|nr:hypothetical protein [Burkholderiaceae bacterium]
MSALHELERRKDRFDTASARLKLKHLRALTRTRLARAEQVRRLHEVLCFMRAHPDNAEVLRAVDALLARFDRRADLRAHRDALAYSGIAGTTIWFPFFYPTARWLAQRWPTRLVLERADTEAGDSIADLLPALLTPVEAHGLRESKLPGFEALDAVRGRESDATFLVRRVSALPADERTREAYYDAINPSCELLPGPDTPNRTRAALPGVQPVWQSGALRRQRPDLAQEIGRPPRTFRPARSDEADALIALAREAMVTRRRDLDAFAYANARDVWWIEDDGGLAFALIGLRRDRRAVVPAIYGGLTLQNGVPVGYHQCDLVGRSAAVSFNTFETFRGGESAHTFARWLAALAHGFGTRSFSIEPYQLGRGNDEGLASGAWWFYAKLGFRPRARAGIAMAQRELALLARSKGHRTRPETLRALADHHLFLDLDPRDPAPLITPAAVGLAAARHLSRLAGSDRAAAVARASAEVMQRCGLASLDGFTADELRAWEGWAPVLSMLQLAQWSEAERAELVRLVRTKATDSERGYVHAFAALPRLEDALARLAVTRSG